MEVNRDPDGILKGITCFALDMDGTVYLGESWIDGAIAFLKRLEETGRRFFFMTNNSSKSGAMYIKKLAKMGLDISPSQLVTSGQATVSYLNKHHSGKRVFLLGNELLSQEFSEAGISLDNKDPEIVVTAFDTTLDYQKLCSVCDFVRAGLPFIATHPDFNCPTETGFIPDIGAIHAFIQASAGRMPDRIIGKPNADIVEYSLLKAGASAAETAMVGDRLYTDVAAGVNNGLTGILVLSGEAALSDIEKSEVKPHLVFTSVKEIIPFL